MAVHNCEASKASVVFAELVCEIFGAPDKSSGTDSVELRSEILRGKIFEHCSVYLMKAVICSHKKGRFVFA